jgi:hypothetical protein
VKKQRDYSRQYVHEPPVSFESFDVDLESMQTMADGSEELSHDHEYEATEDAKHHDQSTGDHVEDGTEFAYFIGLIYIALADKLGGSSLDYCDGCC